MSQSFSQLHNKIKDSPFLLLRHFLQILHIEFTIYRYRQFLVTLSNYSTRFVIGRFLWVIRATSCHKMVLIWFSSTRDGCLRYWCDWNFLNETPFITSWVLFSVKSELQSKPLNSWYPSNAISFAFPIDAAMAWMSTYKSNISSNFQMQTKAFLDFYLTVQNMQLIKLRRPYMQSG